jgi:hypothetical protein
MIPQNGRNGNGTAVADLVPEIAPDAPEAQTPGAQPIDLATRTRQRTRQQFQQNKFVIIGAGALVVALLLFVALSVPHKATVQKPRGTVAGQQDPTQPSESSSVEPSLLPITDSGRPPTKATHEGFFDEQDLQRTATRQSALSNIARPSPSTQSGTLASVPQFPEQWQAPPYQPVADGSTQPGDLSKTEREALEKSSVAYVRNISASQGGSPKLANTEPLIDLGLPAGSRLRARLESAASTAVRTPVLAVIEYNYEREGEIIVPAGAKAVGHIQQADRSGYMTIQFDSLMMPDGAALPIEGVATNLSLGPPKGKVEGKNTGKNVLVRSLSGIGEVGAMLVGRGNLDQPLSEEDMLRERVSNNVGEASDEQVSRLALTEHVVVTIPANTAIYVVLEKTASSKTASGRPTLGSSQSTSSAKADELRQLLQLERELQQTASISEDK